jgi:CCR4-NOT transcription complex subunit 1
LTLARNKPIQTKYLNIKEMLADSYPHNLVTILPLVCKILECAKDSSIFKVQNPWLGPILSLLEEIKKNDIKLN